jgi:hypothetical protein
VPASSLQARYPDVAGYVFENLKPAEGIALVAGTERLTDRIVSLREDKKWME